MSKKKPVNMIDNWMIYGCEGVAIDLHQFEDDDPENPQGFLYNATVTYLLDTDEDGDINKAITVITNITTNCKYCAASSAAMACSELYDVMNNVMIFNENGENFEDISLDDCFDRCENEPIEEELSLVKLKNKLETPSSQLLN